MDSRGRLYIDDVVIKGNVFRKTLCDADTITRHKNRYRLVAFFCKPCDEVLDFPCGTGYGVEIICEIPGISYTGYDNSDEAIKYARYVYGEWGGVFGCRDLERPDLQPKHFDVIACIEGFEHIGREPQIKLLSDFYSALKPGGYLILTTPLAKKGVSGPNPKNAFHVHELSKPDLVEALFLGHFKHPVPEIIVKEEKLTTGEIQECAYAICRKV
jgi:SAM-dependent methyltransferase